MRLGLALSLIVCGSVAHAQDRWPRAPLTEVARAQVGATMATERYGLTGAGTVLCAIDTGVDPSHRDLTGGLGASRVLYWLDAHGDARGVHPELEARFGGAVWRGDDLGGVPGDPHGHGTAIASIAIGDGSSDASIGALAGIAPAARLIVVDAYDGELEGFPDDALIRGVRFCRAIGELEGVLDHLVVLLSLGGHDGAHDGSGALERALDEEARDLPIVVAAGNDGEHAVHASGRLFAGEEANVGVRVPRSDRTDAELALTIATDAPFAIETPDGERSAWIHHALDLDLELDLEGAHVRVEPIEAPSTFRVVLSARDGALASGTYAIVLRGPARFEIWLAGARLGATFLPPAIVGPNALVGEQIAIPATAERVIAVGATVSRTDVGMLTLEGSPGDAALFSSLGPSASGAPRPDLAAPGGWTLAALSSQVRDGDPENLVGGSLARYSAEDGRIAVRGTSVSAAIVAGALLLALETRPAVDARAALIASARGDGRWRADVGFGELDVPRLLEVWSGERDATPAHAVLTGTRPFMPTDPQLWLAARVLGQRDLPAGEVVEIELGDRTWTAPLSFGSARLAITPEHAVVGSTLTVRARVDGLDVDPALVPVVLDRSPRGAARVAGGGCAIAPRATPAPIVVLLALALLHARRRP